MDFVKVATFVIALNFALSGLQKALESIKDKTATDIDNKAHTALGMLLGVLSKVVEWASANRK